MKTQTVGALSAALPRVNLLPPEIEERRALNRAKVMLALGLVVTAGVVGGVYKLGVKNVSSAQVQLDTSTQTHTRLLHQLAALQNVSALKGQLAAGQATLGRATADEVKWSNYLAELGTQVPVGLWLNHVTISQTVTPGAPAGAAAPASSGIATMTFTGFAVTNYNFADWLDQLAKEPAYADVSFTKDQQQVQFSRLVQGWQSSLTVTPDALANSACADQGSC